MNSLLTSPNRTEAIKNSQARVTMDMGSLATSPNKIEATTNSHDRPTKNNQVQATKNNQVQPIKEKSSQDMVQNTGINPVQATDRTRATEDTGTAPIKDAKAPITGKKASVDRPRRICPQLLQAKRRDSRLP